MYTAVHTLRYLIGLDKPHSQTTQAERDCLAAQPEGIGCSKSAFMKAFLRMSWQAQCLQQAFSMRSIRSRQADCLPVGAHCQEGDVAQPKNIVS